MFISLGVDIYPKEPVDRDILFREMVMSAEALIERLQGELSGRLQPFQMGGRFDVKLCEVKSYPAVSLYAEVASHEIDFQECAQVICDIAQFPDTFAFSTIFCFEGHRLFPLRRTGYDLFISPRYATGWGFAMWNRKSEMLSEGLDLLKRFGISDYQLHESDRGQIILRVFNVEDFVTAKLVFDLTKPWGLVERR